MSVVFETGALIALERRDRLMVARVDEIVRNRIATFVPAGVVAQCWRGGHRQYAIARLLRSRAVRIDDLGGELAFRIGIRLAETGTSDVIDAHVALLAARLNAIVYTSDPDDIAVLDPSLRIVTV